MNVHVRVLRTTQVPGYNTSISPRGFFCTRVLFFLYFVRVVRGTCTHAPGSTQVQAFLLSSI